MSELVDQIMSQPEEERLYFAIEVIRRITCDDNVCLGRLRDLYGTNPQQSRLIWALANAPSNILTREQLHGAISSWDPNRETSTKLIDVVVYKTRQRVPFKIHPVWGVGYKIDSDVAREIREAMKTGAWEIPDIPLSPVHTGRRRHYRHWTDEEDEELLRMIQNGSDTWYIAEELGRTERAVQLRREILTSRVRRRDKYK